MDLRRHLSELRSGNEEMNMTGMAYNKIYKIEQPSIISMCAKFAPL